MLFQVWVMNKLVQTLHASRLMQKDDRLVEGESCGAEQQHQISPGDVEYELNVQNKRYLGL